MNDTTDVGAWAIAFTGTGACVSFAMAWALGTRRRLRPRAHLTGRAAVPYWYSPTGLQDERGISALRDHRA
jgi:hypothetical protein